MCQKEIKPYIFISYAHDDEIMAKRIAEFLTENGFDVWIDYNKIRAGQKFNDEIARAIYDSSLFISLVSEKYISKPFCETEVTYAHNHQKACMSVFIEAVAPPPGSALDLIFVGTSMAGFNKNINDESDFQQLCQCILDSEYIKELKNYSFEDAREQPVPFIKPSKFEKVESFYKRNTYGNYYFSEIASELYPPISCGDKTEESSNNNILLINKIKESPQSHFVILGNGGSGKTIALKSIYKSFASIFSPVLYIPLNKIMFSQGITIQSYLKDELALIWDALKIYGRHNASNAPLRLLFDGFNEIQGDKRLVSKEITDIMHWDNTQVIITSRKDFIDNLSPDVTTTVIKLKPLDKIIVKEYIEKKKGRSNISDKMLSLLSNPLMLTLYVNTDLAVNTMYESLLNDCPYYKIQTTTEPSTEAQIIWNFLHSQIFRVNEGTSSRAVCDAYVAIEFFLPFIAEYIIVNNKSGISEEEFSELFVEAFEGSDYKAYYIKRIKIIERKLDISEYNYNSLDKTILNNLAFLIKNSDNLKYDFFHQSFRDFFAAMYIAKKIEHLASGKTKDYLSISKTVYQYEIMKYISEILAEVNAKPIFKDGTLIYPGKEGLCTASTLSSCENALNVLRGEFNEDAQTAVCNLMTILAISRSNQLSNCDFSLLDFRKCNLKGGYYTNWVEHDFYPSSFEGSYINLECFISPGHRAAIQAICTGTDCFFTADSEGIIKQWRFDTDDVFMTLDTGEDAVIHMGFDEKHNKLAVLKANEVYQYDINSNKLTLISHSKSIYKYVRFNQNSQIEVTYDTQPLTWHSPQGVPGENLLPTDMPSGCATLHEGRKELLRSYLFGQIHKYSLTENGVEFVKGVSPEVITKGKCIKAITYNKGGDRFLVAYDSFVFEFDSDSLELIRSLKLASDVNAACYTKNNKVIVAHSVHITILNEDFSVEKLYTGESIPNIFKLLFDNNKLYSFDILGTIKEFSDEMCVTKSRKTNFKISSLTFGTDGLDTENSKFFILSKDPKYLLNGHKGCRVYDFEKNTTSYPSENYEIYDYSRNSENMKYEYYKLSNRIVAINKNNSETISYVNYKGITVYGCSFKNVQGTISEPEGKRILFQNGGLIDE